MFSAYLSTIYTIASVQVLGILSPGPDLLLVLKNSLAGSKKIGLYTMLGIVSGEGVHLAYNILGLGFLFKQYPWVLAILGLSGGAYLLYIGVAGLCMGYRLLRAPADHMMITKAEVNLLPLQAFKMGLFTNLLNIKAALYTLGIFSSLPGHPNPIIPGWLFATEMLVVALATFGAIIMLCTRSAFKAAYHRYTPHIEIGTSLLFLCLGLGIVLRYAAHFRQSLG